MSENEHHYIFEGYMFTLLAYINVVAYIHVYHWKTELEVIHILGSDCFEQKI